MSMPMEWDEPETEVVPLDLTTKKEDNYAVPDAEAERDSPGKLTDDAPLLQSSVKKGVESMPLNLSDRTAFPLQPPPTSANVTQRATVVTLSPKVQDESSSPPQPQCKDHWTPATPSPMMATEHLTPLHGTYADPTAYRHMVVSSAAVPEYNPFPPVLPTFRATQFHQHNRIQHQLTHLHMQQQHLLNLQQNLHKQQKLQLQTAYGGVPLDHASMISSIPVYTATSSPSSSVSNHLPRPTTDDHYHFHRQQQQLQRGLDRENRQHLESCARSRQSDFSSIRYQYMESLEPPMNVEKTRQTTNNNDNNNSSRSSNNNYDEQGLTPGQQHYDQTYVMDLQRNNELARRLQDAKRQKYVENQIIVMYLTKKVKKMEDIKRRLLMANSNILSELV
ncbi:uncharacterized protein LOC132933249 [Metopolophium dirhodum]|uniref:uncharacterized protein LOC132933249 n=1 Tax=Metopolophium dirhodum TaxID=44670 RepID=UPI002990743E|nr:uncharacterized protein LOC132933249 [Metopolophium dirhodum]